MWNNFQSMVDLGYSFLRKSLVFNAQKVLSLVVVGDPFAHVRDPISDEE